MKLTVPAGANVATGSTVPLGGAGDFIACRLEAAGEHVSRIGSPSDGRLTTLRNHLAFSTDAGTDIVIRWVFDFTGGTATSASIVATRVGSVTVLPEIT